MHAGEHIVGPSGNEYTVSSTSLGEGGQVNGRGEGVFEGFNMETHERVAVKKFNFRDIYDECEYQETLTERDSKYTRLKREVGNTVKVAGHPNVVTVYDTLFGGGTAEAPTYLYIVMECGAEGNLHDYVRQRELSEDEARSFFFQIAEGVAWIHAKDVAHRDLKLENIVLCGEECTPKIADFGMSKDFADSGLKTLSKVGTLVYLPPELVVNVGAGPRGDYEPGPVDVWALGVMLYVMVCRKYPFGQGSRLGKDGTGKDTWIPCLKAEHACVCNIQSGTFQDPSAIERLPAALQDLILGCLRVDVRERLSLAELLAHRWRPSAAAAPEPEEPAGIPEGFWPVQAPMDPMQPLTGGEDPMLGFRSDDGDSTSGELDDPFGDGMALSPPP